MTTIFDTQQSHYTSHVAHTPAKLGIHEMLSSQSQSPLLAAAIYDVSDLQDLPDTHTRLPSVRSWSSLRPTIYDGDGEISSATMVPSKKPQKQALVSPLHNESTTCYNSPVSTIEPINFSSTEKAWNGSSATIFPQFSSSIKKSETKASNVQGAHAPWNLADMCRTARAIYEAGPKGEGQKLWSSYKTFRKERKDHTEVKPEPLNQVSAPRWPSVSDLSARPPTRPPSSHVRIALERAVAPTESLSPRNNLSLSRSSYEVPIWIGPDVQQHVDRSKPLPPVPHLQPAPRAKRIGAKLSQPLPTVQPSRTALKSNSHISTNSAKPHPPLPERGLFRTKTSKSFAWWKSWEDKTTEPQVHNTSRDTDKDMPDCERRKKISRPRPLTAIEDGRTVNIAIACGGVGGPGAAISRPPLHDMSENHQGKQEGTTTSTGTTVPEHWREKLISPLGSTGKSKERKRRSSDISFACQGVEEPHQAYVRNVESSRQMERDLRPKPLFSELRGEKRDTRFYTLYCEILDEY
jgi:hypothetical protein